MEEKWNNVELSNLAKKSYTLNHDYDHIRKGDTVNNNEQQHKNNGVTDNGTNKTPTTTPTTTTTTTAATATATAAAGSELLQPGSNIKPNVDLPTVETLVRRLYGITISEIKELISYDDRNYLIKEDSNIKNPLIVTHSPDGYVLKILNSLDSKKTDFIDAQNKVMLYLSKRGIQCPKPIANVNGKHFSLETISGAQHVVRLLNYIPGQIFHEVEKSNYLFYQSGEYIAKIDRALKDFTHEAYETRKSIWMLQGVPQLMDFIYVLKDQTRREMIEEIINAFDKNVLNDLHKMELQTIHGDYNEQNIIVERKKDNTEDYKVVGIIDFGDTSKSPIIFEIGIALTYIILQAESLESGGIFLAGYNSVRPISNDERKYLKYCVAARLAQSLVLGTYTHSLDSSNDYVLVTQERGWKLIEQLWRVDFKNIDEIWQNIADKYLTQSVK